MVEAVVGKNRHFFVGARHSWWRVNKRLVGKCIWTVVVAKWSASLPSTLMIQVQIPLASEFFCTVVRKDKNKWKRGKRWPVLKKLILANYCSIVKLLIMPNDSLPAHRLKGEGCKGTFTFFDIHIKSEVEPSSSAWWYPNPFYLSSFFLQKNLL